MIYGLTKFAYLKRLFFMSFLSFVIAFAPVYANAVVPFVAIAASAGGRVLVQKGGAMLIKKLSKTGIVKAAKANIAKCAKNPAACIGVGGFITAGLGAADLELNVIDNENNLYDIDIYNKTDKISNVCYDLKYKPYRNADDSRTYDNIGGLLSYYDGDFASVTVDSASLNTAISAAASEANAYTNTNIFNGANIAFKTFSLNTQKAGSSTINVLSNVGVVAITKDCGGTGGDDNSVNNTYTVNNTNVDNAIYNYVTNHPQSADLIKEIHNNYEGDYVVNNENIAGDDISNYYDNSVSITNELADEITSGKVDLDKVNDSNCTKDTTGAYNSCDGSDPSDPEPDPEPNDPEPDPASCDNNTFNRKICDFINWVQDDGDITSQPVEQVEIVDKTSDITDLIDRQMIILPKTCPSALQIPFSVMGNTSNLEIDVTPVCNVLEMVRPFVIGISTISMTYIILGVRRNG